ncbi:hypothetical protein [Aequorivita flava]|uniref:Uncharacterized protein n=1 Tax=Aequorivita flava TaxID=3114371 RepID=A0AB35YWE6_9FLAO
MNSIDYTKLLNERFNINNIESHLKQIIKASTINAENRLANFKRQNADYIEIVSMYSNLTDYHLLILGNYIDIKNRIIDLRRNPLYSLYWKGVEENNSVNELMVFIYHFNESKDLDSLLDAMQTELSNIIYYELAFQFSSSYKNSLPNDYLKSKAIDSKFFEQIIIDTQHKKILELENDKFNHDDIFRKYVFNLNAVSIRVIFDFMKSYNLLDSDINFGKFAHMLYPSNDWVFDFNLRDTEMTFDHLEYLLNLLRFFYKGDKSEYQDFLNKKVKITSKHGNYRYGYDLELKMRKTIIKKFETDNDDITNDIISLYQKVESVEMEY